MSVVRVGVGPSVDMVEGGACWLEEKELLD